MSLYKVFTLILVGIIFSSESLAFEFSNNECDFAVNFPFRPSVKKVVQPLGNNIYTNTYMAQAGDNSSGQLFNAQCDTSLRLFPGATMSQKRKMAEWAINEWSKMIGLNHTQMFWEEQGNQETLRMVGQRVLFEAGQKFHAAFQARIFFGQKSMMMVAVAEPARLSPSKEMEKFLNTSVQPR